MPEGDAVRRTARRLDRALAGSLLATADLRVPRFADVDLRGFTVVGTAAVGKHLLTRLQRGDRALTLHSHLRMDGRWVTGRAGPRPLAGPPHEVRVWLASSQQQAVGLRLAMVEVLPTAQEHRLVGHLGPDILGDAWQEQEALARLAAAGSRPLVETLLDQSVVAGLGTIWAAETAFEARISPWAPTSDALPQLPGALSAVRRRMQAGVAASSRREQPQPRVYGRVGMRCLRCGTTVAGGRVGRAPTDRITAWCPSCQAGPGPR